MKICVYFQPTIENDNFEGMRLRKNIKGALELHNIPYAKNLLDTYDIVHFMSLDDEAKIIDASQLRSDVVQILSTVEMKNLANGMVMKYTIVSESEANLREGKISSTTPIAQGLLGKKKGDVVEVKIPQGVIKLEILSISVGA